MNKEIRLKMGEISRICRLLVGGVDICTGYDWRPANIFEAKEVAGRLLKALDEYDELIIKEMEVKK